MVHAAVGDGKEVGGIVQVVEYGIPCVADSVFELSSSNLVANGADYFAAVADTSRGSIQVVLVAKRVDWVAADTPQGSIQVVLVANRADWVTADTSQRSIQVVLVANRADWVAVADASQGRMQVVLAVDTAVRIVVHVGMGVQLLGISKHKTPKMECLLRPWCKPE